MRNLVKIMTENDILEAISKSGYLFESEIAKFMSDFGYFVESNTVYKDPLTGKNREIDLIAESIKENILGVNTKIRYFFELKNNDFPLVLLTELQFNPNTPEEIFKEIITVPNGIQYDMLSGFWENLVHKNQPLFTQYCSFTKKNNNQIMASHPEELYSSLNKLSWYCEYEFVRTNKLFDRLSTVYFRHWLYLPVLLIKDDLYELTIENNESKLNKVPFSRLLFNFHFKNKPRSTTIYVVTKPYLKDFLQDMNILEHEVARKMSKNN